MRTGRLLFGVMVAGLAVMGTWLAIRARDGDIHSAEIEVDGKKFAVAVFRVEPPIAFPVLYHVLLRTELDKRLTSASMSRRKVGSDGRAAA